MNSPPCIPALAASPQCDYPDVFLGPTYTDSLLQVDPSLLTHLNAWFMNSPRCNYMTNPTGFNQSLTNWYDFATPNSLIYQVCYISNIHKITHDLHSPSSQRSAYQA